MQHFWVYEHVYKLAIFVEFQRNEMSYRGLLDFKPTFGGSSNGINLPNNLQNQVIVSENVEKPKGVEWDK